MVKRSNIVRAVIVRTKKTIKRSDGMAVRFDDNAAVIINAENNPRGTRIWSLLPEKSVTNDLQKLFH
jgi:large subunit ribosomal protein L14